MAKTHGNRWKIIKDLPPGGQGWIYLVEDLTGEYTEPVILKRLQNPNRLERFKQEVEAALLLDHQNVVKVLASELEGEEPYFVTPHYKGGNLAEARPWETGGHGRLLNLFGQVCDGALEAHAKGVIHRDLKPDNIFLDSDREKGHAVVGDFGLCLLEDEPRITTTGEAVGSRHFMAPELESGFANTVTTKCDVYSLGKLLYWLMSSGSIFSREKHRQPEFDLVKLTGNLYLEHANRLLDKMIIEDPVERWTLIGVRSHVDTLKRLIVGRYNPVGPDITPPCNYCGIGEYVLAAANREQAAEIIFRTGLPGDWRILVCNYCGHTQTFRPDIARNIGNLDSTPWD